MAGTPGKHLLAVYVGNPSEIEDEFNKWYNAQHVPELAPLASRLGVAQA